MNPEIFSIGSLSIRWYSVLILTGIIIAILLAEKESKKFKYEKECIKTDQALLAGLYRTLPRGALHPACRGAVARCLRSLLPRSPRYGVLRGDRIALSERRPKPNRKHRLPYGKRHELYRQALSDLRR